MEIAKHLSQKQHIFKDIIIDDSYFANSLNIPGKNRSSNPYDAPVGALSANFNTVYFNYDEKGKLITAESQTPLLPSISKKIHLMRLKKGRYTFSHNQQEITTYAGELLLYFLRKNNAKASGNIRLGLIDSDDKLIYRYHSRFTLEEVIKKMMKYSNNFIANQLLITMGAKESGEPGDLKKGANVIRQYTKQKLGLEDFKIVEGSGLSRENRVSALQMLSILKAFSSYRYLLNQKDNFFYKTGTLQGIKNRVGYFENGSKDIYYYIIFLSKSDIDPGALIECLKDELVFKKRLVED